LRRFNAPADSEGTAAIAIWTTTPWTLPANLAVALHAELDYSLVRFEQAGKTWLMVLAEALEGAVMKRYGVEQYGVVGRAKGAALEGLVLNHPFYDRQVPVILGDHVTADGGTGAVHTAPGHGVDDFNVGRKYGLEPYNPVGG